MTDPREIKARALIRVVCDHSGVPFDKVMGRSRDPDVVRARHVSMYLVRKEVDLSYTEMGKLYNKDHTSVISAVRKVKNDSLLQKAAREACEDAPKADPDAEKDLPHIGMMVRRVDKRPSAWRAEVRGVVDGCLVLRRWSQRASGWNYFLEARDAWDFGELQEIG